VATPKPIPNARAFGPDDRQRQAIEHVHGPLLAIAGAGTGKTTVLTRRVARLIQEGHARQGEVLALTYTDNAAQEMRERVKVEVGCSVSGLQVMTFHAYCHGLLIRNGLQFGVLDDKDLWIFLRKRIPQLQLNYFVRAANVSRFLEDLLDFMRRCQDELVGPEKYAAYVAQLERGELPIPRVCKTKDREALNDEAVMGRCREIARVFAKVEHMLQTENLGTFGHMITRAYELLAQDSTVLARERDQARFILVDEFQDANFAQVKILQILSGDECNVFAVGDPDQAIYRFRGASSAAFALFQRTFPGTSVVALDKNRRSTTPILRCAYSVISKNPEVFAGPVHGKNLRRSPLISFREEEAVCQGKKLPEVPVDAVVLGGKDIECSDLAETILSKRRELRCKWSDFAVLYRQHLHRDELVREFVDRGIPYSIENMDVMDTPQARDLLACIGAVVSEKDDASLFRVAALPQFTIDPEKLRAGIKSLPREREHGLVAAVLPKIDGGPAVLDSLQQVRDETAKKSAKSRAAIDIIIRVFEFDGSSPPLTAILAFVKQWEEKPIVKTRELAELLEYLDLFRQAGGTINIATETSDAVRLMTVHVAKGLEYKHVFIIRASSPSFPSGFKETLVEFPAQLRDPDSLAQKDDKALHGEEERRLFYVAMTRARDSLTLYANRSKSKKDPTPPGYFRDLFGDATLNLYLRRRPARALQTEIFAQASPAQLSGAAQWVGLPPASDLGARLSASAVQTYENCPLQFKLDREWRIPGEVPAAMQYGGSMHRVLRDYYDSVRMGRELTEEALIELFRADLADAGIQDRYQHELYERQGANQLKEFLIACRSNPIPQVLHTEEFFEMKIGKTAVVGRIDRIDKLPGAEVVVIDYKTGKPQSQDDADRSLQLSIYALAVRQKWGYKADHLAFYNLDENNTVITRRSNAELQAAEGRVEEVAAEIAAGNFDPKPSFNCRFCAYRSLCPATEKRLYDAKNN
jgi:DNA helicase II / ATP-dependent DNA helicase PcrA